jgi:hypothetical protein
LRRRREEDEGRKQKGWYFKEQQKWLSRSFPKATRSLSLPLFRLSLIVRSFSNSYMYLFRSSLSSLLRLQKNNQNRSSFHNNKRRKEEKAATEAGKQLTVINKEH